MERSHLVVDKSWLGVVKIAVAIGVAYFLAGRLGLTLRAEPGVAVFWPAAGIAIGALIALGPSARLPVAAAVVVATIACSLMIGRNARGWLSPSAPSTQDRPSSRLGCLSAGSVARSSWTMCSECCGFLGASALGSAIAAVGCDYYR